jgi:hypothetical protein
MTRLFAGVALAALLAACATPKNASAPDKVVVQQSKVAVAVACSADTGSQPAFADTTAAIRAAPNVFERAKLYAAGRQQRIARDAKLQAGNAGCAPSR